MKKTIFALAMLVSASAFANTDPNYWDKGSNIHSAVLTIHQTYKAKGTDAAIQQVQQCHALANGNDLTPLSEQCYAMDSALIQLVYRDSRRDKTAIPKYYEGYSQAYRVMPYMLGYDRASASDYARSLNNMVNEILQDELGEQLK